MTRTSTFKGLDPEGRSNSRILRPPGGGSSFSFGVGESQQQQLLRRHMMTSNIFGIPDDEPTPASYASETDIPHSSACGNPEDLQKTCNQEECGEAADHMGEAEIPETESRKDGSQAAKKAYNRLPL
ncbi:PREDICTED: hematological and neurological expressed 1 protein-like [Nanorana parkeri]|uniref:hematological and neurological expressed 1 protein-like n=1 Tax=Nanorana parkeri TaxID=125878 RepID=UPI0008541343|nr:PREDICTED: hematological and neurological expressed 1 protein-like [Nanorana parkeri]